MRKCHTVTATVTAKPYSAVTHKTAILRGISMLVTAVTANVFTYCSMFIFCLIIFFLRIIEILALTARQSISSLLSMGV